MRTRGWILVLGLTTVAACATSPLGRKQLRLFPSSEVATMGITAFQEMKKELPQVQDPHTLDYVRCVANAITAQVKSPNVPAQWEVVVFEDDEPNAFALPGGKIGVYTGILMVAKNQDQLATVIGHEVAHVLSEHSNERVSQQAVAGALMQAAGAAGMSSNVLAALGIGAQVGVLLPFSRTQESEADLLGLDLMASAGFDPRQSIPFWKNMEAAGGGKSPEFLSTHPSSQTRMADLEERIPQVMKLYERAVAEGRRPKCG